LLVIPKNRVVDEQNERDVREKMLDKTIADSFLSSDPPSSIPDPDSDSFEREPARRSPSNPPASSYFSLQTEQPSPKRDASRMSSASPIAAPAAPSGSNTSTNGNSRKGEEFLLGGSVSRTGPPRGMPQL
jgi:hypothetical protein